MPLKYNIDDIRSRVSGMWPSVLASCGGISLEILDGRHHPCPKCGGTDRFRMLDATAGALFCNQCFNCNNGDGFAAIQWLTGLNFEDACQRICDHLGIDTTPQPRSSSTGLKQTASTFNTATEAINEHSANVKMGRPSGHWEYHDRDRKLVGAVVRWNGTDPSSNEPKKEYRPVSLRGDGRWSCDAMPSPRPLYRLPDIIAQNVVAVCEGEKTADAAVYFGLAGTTCAGGAQAVRHADWDALAGKRVVIFPDHDESGEHYAEEVTKHVLNLKVPAKDVRVIRMTEVMKPGAIIQKKWDLANLHTILLDLPEAQRVEKFDGITGRIASAMESAKVITKAAKPKSHKKPVKPPAGFDDMDGRVCNYKIEEHPGDDGPEYKTIPLPIHEISDYAKSLTGDWPRRVGDLLFVDTGNDTTLWLKNKSALFAFYGRRTEKNTTFHKAAGFVPKDEFFEDMIMTATNYAAVETAPHEPLMDGHYYTCGPVESGDGAKLRELLDRFRPETPTDKSLIMAAFLTPFWGGRGGSRPAFCITAKDGLRGSGKSILVDIIAVVAGGMIDISDKEDVEVMKARLLTPEAMKFRIARFDNIKSHNLSWAELESLITSPIISGKRMYHGEGQRPNTVTYYLTMNGVDLSTDMAQRCIITSVVKHSDPGNWKDDTLAFAHKYRREITADILGVLRSKPATLDGSSRWGDWEQQVLAKTPNPIESQKLIRERLNAADVNGEGSDIVEEFFKQRLEKLGYEFDTVIFIPSRVACNWYTEALREPPGVQSASRALMARVTGGSMKCLSASKNHKIGRGYMFRDPNTDARANISVDLNERIDQYRDYLPKMW